MSERRSAIQKPLRRRLAVSPSSFSFSLLIAFAAVILFFIPCATERLQFDRAPLAAGEWWRLLTCHATHWTADHLAWDVLMFATLGIACEKRVPWRFIGCIATSALLIPLGVWWLMPAMPTYRGLSGIDSALFVLLTAALLREGVGRPWILVALAGFIAKIAFECGTGRAIFVAGAIVPIPLAHAIGAACGLGWSLPIVLTGNEVAVGPG